MAKGTLGHGMRDGTETVVWLGNTGVLGEENKKKGKKLNITVGDADCIHRVPAVHQTAAGLRTVVVRRSVRGELSSLPAPCTSICRSEKMPVGDRR